MAKTLGLEYNIHSQDALLIMYKELINFDPIIPTLFLYQNFFYQLGIFTFSHLVLSCGIWLLQPNVIMTLHVN